MSQDTSSTVYFQAPDERFWTQPQVPSESIQIVATEPAEDSDFVAPQAEVAREYKGRFQKGFDPRRHQFTPEERSRGFWTAIAVMGISIGVKLHQSGRWPSFRKGGAR